MYKWVLDMLKKVVPCTTFRPKKRRYGQHDLVTEPLIFQFLKLLYGRNF